MNDLIVEQTADGSYTLTSNRFNSSYHSIHGAMQESIHVFIEQGLRYYLHSQNRNEVKILEMGLGTGLNLWLTYQEAIAKQITMHFTALEAFPIEPAAFPMIIRDAMHLELLNAPWDAVVVLEQGKELYKRKMTLEDFLETEKDLFDIIYYDAFGPGSQPELWDAKIFQKLFQLTEPGGVLVTYCAKGEVRRAMQAAGYHVSRLPGPPYKRHMTRAVKPVV